MRYVLLLVNVLLFLLKMSCNTFLPQAWDMHVHGQACGHVCMHEHLGMRVAWVQQGIEHISSVIEDYSSNIGLVQFGRVKAKFYAVQQEARCNARCALN